MKGHGSFGVWGALSKETDLRGPPKIVGICGSPISLFVERDSRSTGFVDPSPSPPLPPYPLEGARTLFFSSGVVSMSHVHVACASFFLVSLRTLHCAALLVSCITVSKKKKRTECPTEIPSKRTGILAGSRLNSAKKNEG